MPFIEILTRTSRCGGSLGSGGGQPRGQRRQQPREGGGACEIGSSLVSAVGGAYRMTGGPVGLHTPWPEHVVRRGGSSSTGPPSYSRASPPTVSRWGASTAWSRQPHLCCHAATEAGRVPQGRGGGSNS